MELIVVILLLGIASLGIITMQSNISNGQATANDLQVGTRLLEECAEQVLAVRRYTLYGYEEISSATGARFGTAKCDTVGALGSYAIPTVAVSTAAVTWCPSGALCKTVSISQGTLPTLRLIVVDY